MYLQIEAIDDEPNFVWVRVSKTPRGRKTVMLARREQLDDVLLMLLEAQDVTVDALRRTDGYRAMQEIHS
ncbi:hypothetical protein [Paraburkholderia aspalathi]|uniref:hypothetical protein n=1 Tax=Paraburkholderia aspalathi TaxID=1324617 RepID=UPI001BAD02EF|nr:hypothetical protein [Paraburkholderia aspalathi]